MGEILPALKKAIDDTPTQRDINSSCMVAMAKIGADHNDFKLIDVFTPRLKKERPGDPRDRRAGDRHRRDRRARRRLTCWSASPSTRSGVARRRPCLEVDDRTRSFATYGLGLDRQQDHQASRSRSKAFAALKKLLQDEKSATATSRSRRSRHQRC
jgi:hypothetical protein